MFRNINRATLRKVLFTAAVTAATLILGTSTAKAQFYFVTPGSPMPNGNRIPAAQPGVVGIDTSGTPIQIGNGNGLGGQTVVGGGGLPVSTAPGTVNLDVAAGGTSSGGTI